MDEQCQKSCQCLQNNDQDSFIVYIKTEDIHVDIAKDVETRCDISNYELDHYTKK